MMQAITLKKIENKVSQMGHTKKYLKKEEESFSDMKMLIGFV
jgi:hypothetical protein